MKRYVAVLAVAGLFGCGGAKSARESMSAASMLNNIKKLSSDEFEGRGPGSPGEEKTVQFLIEQFRRIGLEPGNPDSTYVQQVPLVGITSQVTGSIQVAGKRVELHPLQDFVGVGRPQKESIEVKDSGIVFVGYGVVAPEYNWDDYKGVDLKGKTLLMLVNDPPTGDQSLFKGKAMTYYGRWTYKYDIANEKGAAGAIIVHETGPAGYPFEVITGSRGRENFDIATPDKNQNRMPLEAWVTLDKAKELLQAAGQDFDALKKQAATREFKPVPLKAKASFQIKNQIREVQSRNVVGKLTGSDPKLRDEYVIYTAHWDHLGRDETKQGDQIFNGAVDNASGTAGLLELAQAFAGVSPRPKRTLVFLSVTAEEKGLLGARYYADNPLYPLNRTVANINMDSMNPWGKTEDLVVVGKGQSTLEDVLAAVAKEQGRTLVDEPTPEKGFYYRSDHFEFAKKGVPALYLENGERYVGKPAGFSEQKRDEYTNKDYHKVSDEVKPGWDLAGAVDDLKVLFEVGYRVAQADTAPQWKQGSEFKNVKR
ncbi:MAG: M28 family peptidase [Bryobacterales bacterium]|nr:M28 family peptidase [Bryobacterales bacterium]